MKKIFLLLMLLLVTAVCFVSCDVSGSDADGSSDDRGEGNESGEEQEESEPESFIYNGTSELYFIFGEGIKETSAVNLQNYVDSVRGSLSMFAGAKSEEHAHEIVIGNTDREITKTAKLHLDRLQREGSYDYGYLIYSDGSSIAIVFDEDENKFAEHWAYDYFKENFAVEELIAPEGCLYKNTFNLVEYYKEEDNAFRERQWEALKKALDPEIADDFITALKDLYSLYTPDVVTWLANLYEPNICICYGLYGKTECEGTKYCGTAGIYYSNSGRDSFGYLPDVESAMQGLGFLQSSGMSYLYGGRYDTWLPEEMKYKMGLYAQALQDENGFFYHPQWGKDFVENNKKESRRARDLGHATGLLSLAGLEPFYTTPNGIPGSLDKGASSRLTHPIGEDVIAAVSIVILTSNDNYASHFENESTFRTYLESYDIRHKSYSVGNRIGSQVGQIQARDKVIGNAEDPTPLMDELIEYLVKNQNPETGCWNWNYKEKGIAHEGAELYESVNGLLKIGGDFTAAGVKMPCAKEAATTAMRAITDPQKISAVTDLYNTWYSIQNVVENLRKCGGEEGNREADEVVAMLQGLAVDGLRVSKEKIAVFKKADGSFSYTPMYSCQTSQGCEVALPKSVEGDVNATVISVNGIIGHALKALELGGYRPILFGEAERLIFLEIINNAESVVKTRNLPTSGINTPDFDSSAELLSQYDGKADTPNAVTVSSPVLLPLTERRFLGVTAMPGKKIFFPL